MPSRWGVTRDRVHTDRLGSLYIRRLSRISWPNPALAARWASIPTFLSMREVTIRIGAKPLDRYTEHHPDYPSARGAQRHSYPDLACPSADSVRHHAVKSDGSHEECRDAKERGQLGDMPLGDQSPVDLFVDGAETQDR
jgi:hypothetical protein